MINTIRNDQLKFQTDLRSTVVGLQSIGVPMGEKMEGSATQVGSTSPVQFGVGGIRSTKNFGVNGGDGGGIGGYGMYMGGGVPPGFQGIQGYHGGGNGGGSGNWRFCKLDMPVFDGTDPDGWILRVERYFAFYKLTETEMLEAVVVAFEGDALRWYQWEQKCRPIRFWGDLKEFILR